MKKRNQFKGKSGYRQQQPWVSTVKEKQGYSISQDSGMSPQDSVSLTGDDSPMCHTLLQEHPQRPGTSVGMAKGIGIASSNLNFILILMEGMRNEEGGTGREQTSQMVIKCSC